MQISPRAMTYRHLPSASAKPVQHNVRFGEKYEFRPAPMSPQAKGLLYGALIAAPLGLLGGWLLSENKPQNTPPVNQVTPAAPAKATSQVQGTLQAGGETGVFVVKDEKNNKQFSFQQPSVEQLKGWIQSHPQVFVTSFQPLDEQTGTIDVHTIHPTNVVQTGGHPTDGPRAAVEIWNYNGRISYNAENQTWVLSVKFGPGEWEDYRLNNVTDDVLTAWFKPGVKVDIQGEISNRPDSAMQGTPLSVKSVQPVYYGE